MRPSTWSRVDFYWPLLPLAVFVAYLFVMPPTADDVWWRLHSGDRILRTGQVQSQNVWAYRDTHHEWVNHAAGHDLVAAAVHRVAGRRGLVFLYVLPMIWLAARVLRPFGRRPQRGDPRPLRGDRRDLAWGLFVPPLLAIHYALRPYVFSDVFFFIAMGIAARWHDRETLSLRDALPVLGLFFLWGQLHGAVWPGVLFFGLFAMRWSRLARLRLTEAPAELWRLRWLALLPVAALANVNHWHGLLLAWRYATGGHSWLTRLTEWQPAGSVVLLFAGAFAGGFVFAWRGRGFATARLLPLWPLAVAGALQIRHLPWLVLGSVALLQGADGERRADGQGTPEETAATPDGVVDIWPVRHAGPLLGVLCVLLALIPAFLHADRLEDPRFHPSSLYDRIEARCDPGVPLRVFTTHAWGGSLVHRFHGRLAPFLDARNDCFSKETFDRYFRITRLLDGWYAVLLEDRPDGAALPAAHPLVPQLLRHGWIRGAEAGHGVFLVSPGRGPLCR
ncbi:MAG: hypothetical protein CVU59_11355 [Deltaproteobacteria bacterium HGW-Deltaproteobacteria-17]|nr:MAG: hypothetical protein CVU59_11355 [Deltaproteobacteria bacterium HGW-Deltaproteobacteria-17]